MPRTPSRGLLNALRTTISQLEKATDLGPGDPALAELKHILLRRVAELERLELLELSRTPSDAVPSTTETAPILVDSN
jgi:hypothetical protein